MRWGSIFPKSCSFYPDVHTFLPEQVLGSSLAKQQAVVLFIRCGILDKFSKFFVSPLASLLKQNTNMYYTNWSPPSELYLFISIVLTMEAFSYLSQNLIVCLCHHSGTCFHFFPNYKNCFPFLYLHRYSQPSSDWSYVLMIQTCLHGVNLLYQQSVMA